MRGPTDFDDTLVVADFPLGQTVAIDLSNGRSRWSVEGEKVRRQALARRSDGGSSIFQFSGDELRAIDAASGEILWRSREQPEGAGILAAYHETIGELVVRELNGDHNDDLLFSFEGLTSGAEEQLLIALDGSSGGMRWSERVVLWEASPPVAGEPSSVAILREPTELGVEVALVDGGGAQLWSVAAPADSKLSWWPGDVSAGPMVEVLHPSGIELRRVDDGSLFSATATAAAPNEPPAHVDWDGDGRLDVVLACDDRTLVGLRPDGTWTGAVTFDSRISSVRASGDVNGDGFADLLVDANGPAVVSGRTSLWRRSASDAIRATPTVADLDGDGDVEVAVFGGFTNVKTLHIFNAESGILEVVSTAGVADPLRGAVVVPRADGAPGHDLLTLHAHTLERFAGSDGASLAAIEVPLSYSAPRVVDLDGDGYDEVVVTPWEDDQPLEVRRLSDLDLLWSREAMGGAWGAPTVLPAADPGAPRLIFGLHDGTALALDGRLKELWRHDLGARQIYAPEATDLDDDGTVELLTTAVGKGGAVDLVALAAADGSEVQRWSGYGAPLGGAQRIMVGPEGAEEALVIVATEALGVAALTIDGGTRWQTTVGGGAEAPRASAPLVIEDLEGDGVPEVIAAFYDGAIYVLDATTGRLRWRYVSGGPNIEATPVVADLDGDGLAEVLVAGHDRELVVVRSPGTTAP